MEHKYGTWKIDKDEREYDEYGNYFEGIKIVDTTDEMNICEMCGGLSPLEVETNASLIAAAPDMLEALTDALAQISYLRRKLSDKQRRFVAPTSNVCEEKILNAIAKAEGK